MLHTPSAAAASASVPPKWASSTSRVSVFLLWTSPGCSDEPVSFLPVRSSSASSASDSRRVVELCRLPSARTGSCKIRI